MKGFDVIVSNKNNEWNTPPEIMEAITSVLPLSLDCAATQGHEKFQRYITPDMDETWTAEGETGLFLNPPYSPPKLCTKLVEKTIRQAQEYNIPAVILIPSRTETNLWQSLVWPNCIVIMKKGRIAFIPGDAKPNPEGDVKRNPAAFPSAFVLVNVSIEDAKKIATNLGTPHSSIVLGTNLL